MIVLLWFIILANLVDGLLTIYLLESGIAVAEANPLLAPLVESFDSYVPFMLAKMVLFCLGCYVLYHTKEYLLARVAIVGIAVVHAGVLLWHLHGLGVV